MPLHHDYQQNNSQQREKRVQRKNNSWRCFLHMLKFVYHLIFQFLLQLLITISQPYIFSCILLQNRLFLCQSSMNNVFMFFFELFHVSKFNIIRNCQKNYSYQNKNPLPSKIDVHIFNITNYIQLFKQVKNIRLMFRKYARTGLIDSLQLYQISEQSDSSTELDKDSIKQFKLISTKRQLVRRKINILLEQQKSSIQKPTDNQQVDNKNQKDEQEKELIRIQTAKISILEALVANINNCTNQKQQTGQRQIEKNSLMLFPTSLVYPEIQTKRSQIYEGGIGHYTYYFKRPIIQGNYYIEFKILQTLKHSFEQQQTNQKIPLKGSSSVRIGFCPCNGEENTYMHKSLGVAESFGIHLQKGLLITQSKAKRIFDCRFKLMDVAGLLFHCQSPSKNRQKSKIHKKNYFVLYKNNEQIYKGTNILKDDIYCFAFSLYNFARLQIRIAKKSQQYTPKLDDQTVKAYEQCLYETIIYPDLKQCCVFDTLTKKQLIECQPKQNQLV